jgi:hypothetical protein
VCSILFSCKKFCYAFRMNINKYRTLQTVTRSKQHGASGDTSLALGRPDVTAVLPTVAYYDMQSSHLLQESEYVHVCP